MTSFSSEEIVRVVGKHTEYWQQYQKSQVRGSLRLVAAIAAWILVVILVAIAQDGFGDFFPVAMAAVFAGLVATLVALGKDAYKVTCPECGAPYKRNKWGGQCPSCGLRLLQHDP